MAVGDTYLRINGRDNKGIYGKLRSCKSHKLIIHLHGMTHSMNHMLELYAADYFPPQGYDHYRTGFYPREADARNLATITIADHVSDILKVVEHFSPLYDSLYITAHSLGGLCALIANPPNIKAMSLWDPSFDVTHFWSLSDCLTYMPEREQYQLDYGNVFVISKELVEEFKQYPDEQCLKLAAKVTTPTQLIIPEQSIFNASPHSSPENYRTAFTGKFDLQKMNNANHIFANQGNPQKLMELTSEWFVNASI